MIGRHRRYWIGEVVAWIAPIIGLLSVIGGALYLNKIGGVPRLDAPGWQLAAGAALIISGLASVICYSLALRASIKRALRPLLLSHLAVFFAVVVIELGLRTFGVSNAIGSLFAGVELLPHDWSRARLSIAKWSERTYAPESVFEVHDDLLGWDLGRGRRSADGFYATSVEGVRSAQPNDVLMRSAVGNRVALIGDSFTFGQEVAFDQTWGSQLQRLLPDGSQVLNFGVPSHGLDQTLLKFARDVGPWRPQVTVVGFLNAGPLRSLGIYAFLRPALELPYSKPRFVLAGDSLVTINSPAVTPKQLIGYESIESLPHIHLDHWFLRQNWAPPSVDLHILRWLYGRFPRWQAMDVKQEADAARTLTSRIMRQLRNEIQLAGSKAVMVYLPVHADLIGGGTRHRDGLIADLKGHGIEVVDAGPCMTRHVPLERLFLGENERRVNQADLGPAHYSPEGNGALARCLAPLIAELLPGLDDSRVETQ